MPEYIEREAAIEAAKHAWAKGLEPTQYIELVPAANVAPVKHGRWSQNTVVSKKAGYGVRYYFHAECEVNPCRLFEKMDDYCPHCGAKMDLGGEQ